jgi:Ca-activated chloride channel family protein
MRFLFPYALTGLALLALPVAIHLLMRRRATRIDFPTLRFLRATRSEHWIPRRIQQPLLLAIRLLTLGLLAIGLAHPFLSRAAGPERLTVLLLDRSFSMRAANRAVVAREQARTVVNKLGPSDRAAIVTFDCDAVVLVQPTTDRAALLAALDQYQPGYGLAAYGHGVAFADALLRTDAALDKEIVLLSDFQASGLRDESLITLAMTEVGENVTPIAVGGRLDRNSYWTELRVEPSSVGSVLSATEVTEDSGDVAATRRTWLLNSPTGEQPEISWRRESNGDLTGQLHITTGDDFADDNTRSFVVAQPRSKGALLLADQTDATVYLRAALTTNVASGPTAVNEPELKSTVPDAASLDQFSLVVATLHGQVDPVILNALKGYAERGGAVWLCAGNDLDAGAWDRVANGSGGALPVLGFARLDRSVLPRLAVSDASAPILQELSPADRVALNAVPVKTGFALTRTDGTNVIMRWSNGLPAMIQQRVGEGSVIFLGTSPERESSGLGLSGVLPQLAAAIIAAGTERSPVTETIGAASMFTGQKIEVDGPDGSHVSTRGTELTRNSGQAFGRPGIYRLTADGRTKFLALAPPVGESDCALADADSIKQLFARERPPASKTAAVATETHANNNWWRWLVGSAAIFLLLEWMISLRKAGPKPRVAESPSA